MCLANALRFVVRGTVGEPADYARDIPEMDVAEKLVLAVINEGGGTYEDIPQFNDQHGRTYAEIQATLDRAVELLRPHVTKGPVVIAEAIMDDAENEEIRAAVWQAENEMWDDWLVRHGLTWRGGGYRDQRGRFASLPRTHGRRRRASSTRGSVTTRTAAGRRSGTSWTSATRRCKAARGGGRVTDDLDRAVQTLRGDRRHHRRSP